MNIWMSVHQEIAKGLICLLKPSPIQEGPPWRICRFRSNTTKVFSCFLKTQDEFESCRTSARRSRMSFERGKWHSHYGLISFLLLNTRIPKTGKASGHGGSKRDVATNGFVQKVGIHQISMTVLTMGMTMNYRIASVKPHAGLTPTATRIRAHQSCIDLHCSLQNWECVQMWRNEGVTRAVVL